MTPVKGADGYVVASALCIKDCGRQRQHGKDRMCCRCWRAEHGLPPRSPFGGRPTREAVPASAADPLAAAWSELQASGVPPDALLVEDVPNTAPKVGAARCRCCRLRWPQTYGLCYRCARELAAADGYSSVRLYLEAMHTAREQAKLAGGVRPDLVPRPVSTLVVDGVEYEIESSSVRPLEPGEAAREIARARSGAAADW